MAYRGTNVPAEEPGPIHEAPEIAPTPVSPRRRLRNSVIVVAVIIAIVLIAVYRYRVASSNQAAQAAASARGRAVPVAVAAVQVRDVPVDLEGLGNVNALNTVTVKTRIDGQLLRFNFREGQQVHAGEELAVIDPRPSEAQLAQADAAKFKDEASLENARRDLEHAALGAQTQPIDLGNDQQLAVGVVEVLVLHRAGGDIDVARHADLAEGVAAGGDPQRGVGAVGQAGVDAALLIDWHLILFEVEVGNALPEDTNQEIVGELVLVGEAGSLDSFEPVKEGLVGFVALNDGVK